MNEVQAMGDEESSNEVVPEEGATNDIREKAGASTAHNTHHLSETSMENLMILAWY